MKKPTSQSTLTSYYEQLSLLIRPSSIGLVFLVYINTLLPSVGYSGDTAKFQFIGKILGTPHPTGYPTYIGINHLFVTLLPIKDIAYRANLLSAILAVIAIIYLGKILDLLQENTIIKSVSLLTFGFLSTFWSQALIAEVYTLNVAFFCMVVYYLIRWHLQKDRFHFWLAITIYSLSLGNHMTVILLLPAIGYMIWFTDKDIYTQPKNLLYITLIILLGIGQYSYLFFRSINPNTLYLETTVTSWGELISVLSGGEFKGQFSTFAVRDLILIRLPFLLKLILIEFKLLLPFIPFGFFYISHKQKLHYIKNLFVIYSICIFVFVLNYDISDIFVYLIPLYVVLVIFLSSGMEYLWQKLLPVESNKKHLLSVILYMLPLLLGIYNLPYANQKNNNEIPQMAQELQPLLMANTMIVTDYSYIMYLTYYKLIENFDLERITMLNIFSTQANPIETLTSHHQFLSNVNSNLPIYCLGTQCEMIAGEKIALREIGTDIYTVNLRTGSKN